MTVLAAVRGALPPYRHAQADITDAVAEMTGAEGSPLALLRRVHASAGVDTRHTVLPLEDYARLDGFDDANETFIRAGLDLGQDALERALAAAGLSPPDVDLVMTVSVTGVAAPSLEARLTPRVGLREDVKRVPVFGLGCVAGAAGLARLHDYLAGHPDDVAVLLSVECCSLTLQRDDTSTANLVASGLFGDGAAAVVAVGDQRAARLGLSGPRVVASRSRLYPDTERVMGWDIGGSGFTVVLDKSVADVVRAYLPDDVSRFLEDHGLHIGDIATWISHPGGPRVLEAVRESLDLKPDALALTWDRLAREGNLSSASVLHVLADTLEAAHQGHHPGDGAPGLVLAMGPGFCAEMVLLRW